MTCAPSSAGPAATPKHARSGFADRRQARAGRRAPSAPDALPVQGGLGWFLPPDASGPERTFRAANPSFSLVTAPVGTHRSAARLVPAIRPPGMRRGRVGHDEFGNGEWPQDGKHSRQSSDASNAFHFEPAIRMRQRHGCSAERCLRLSPVRVMVTAPGVSVRVTWSLPSARTPRRVCARLACPCRPRPAWRRDRRSAPSG